MMKNKFKISGKIIFDPVDLTRKHKDQSKWKKSVIVLIDNIDFCKYYSWFVKKRYNLELQMPLRGLHFTIINDKVSDHKKYLRAKDKYNKKNITITHDINIRTDSKHWWFKAECELAKEVRKSCGLPPDPYWGFHITVGRADGALREEHSKYIHELIKKYGKEYN